MQPHGHRSKFVQATECIALGKATSQSVSPDTGQQRRARCHKHARFAQALSGKAVRAYLLVFIYV